ncbi:MAG: hypothetical protein U5L96_13605 [Owenweeksia sp.]|nr:hypothetical protein [Owenweeksia sp.]
MDAEKEIAVYFHVGIAKTGTTFLQDRVFPFLKISIISLRGTIKKR